MTALLILPVALPMVAVGLLLALPHRVASHRVAGIGVPLLSAATGLALLTRTSDGTVLVQHVGGWPPGVAISMAADTFSTLMLTVTGVVTAACLVFASAAGEDRQRWFVPLVLLMSAGANGAFLAADLFTLFVLVEVMLVPSYALLARTGGHQRVRAARIYLAVNLMASTLFLAGVALLYGVTGSVNLGALAGAATASPAVAVAGAVVLLALGIKSAIVPLHGWLPRTYPHATPAVTALFSALLTKVGVYAMLRLVAVLYEGAAGHPALWMAAAVATMVIGVLGALGETGMRSVLTFHMVSQIGYIVLGVALFSVAGLAAAIFYLVQYIPVKAALLLCAGAVRVGYGTDRLSRLGGLAGRHPLLALPFVAAALSLAGLPPFSGFVAKFAVLRAAADQGNHLAFTVAVGVSLLTLLSMVKIWNGGFWGDPDGTVVNERPVNLPVALVAPALMLAALSLAAGVGAQPLLALADTAAEGLVHTASYAAAVRSR